MRVVGAFRFGFCFDAVEEGIDRPFNPRLDSCAIDSTLVDLTEGQSLIVYGVGGPCIFGFLAGAGFEGRWLLGFLLAGGLGFFLNHVPDLGLVTDLRGFALVVGVLGRGIVKLLYSMTRTYEVALRATFQCYRLYFFGFIFDLGFG